MCQSIRHSSWQPQTNTCYGPHMPRALCASLRMTIECPDCTSAVHVNGRVPRVLCHCCQAVVELTGRYAWPWLLNYQSEPIPELRRLTSGNFELSVFEVLDQSQAQHGLSRNIRGLRLDMRWENPSCHACKRELDPSAVASAAVAGRPVFCTGCGAPVPLRLPDDEERGWIWGVTCVVGETASRGNLLELPAQTQAVKFACLGCGAPLDADGKNRILRCSYCGADSYLPDALWLRLNPASRRIPWFVVLSRP